MLTLLVALASVFSLTFQFFSVVHRNRQLTQAMERQRAAIAGLQREIDRRDYLLYWWADLLMKSGKTPEDMFRWMFPDERPPETH